MKRRGSVWNVYVLLVLANKNLDRLDDMYKLRKRMIMCDLNAERTAER